MTKVRQSAAARNDLVENFVYLAETGGADVAERFLKSAEAAFGDLAAFRTGDDEAVVLLGGDVRHWIEDVREELCALRHRPFFHGGRDDVRDGGIQRGPGHHRVFHRLEGVFGQSLFHGREVENIARPDVLERTWHCARHWIAVGNLCDRRNARLI